MTSSMLDLVVYGDSSTPAMRRAMAKAEIGDEVYRGDPTVNRLKECAAKIFEREATLFLPSGSMGSQVAVGVRTPWPGRDLGGPGPHLSARDGDDIRILGLRGTHRLRDGGILQWDHIEPLVHVGGGFRGPDSSDWT